MSNKYRYIYLLLFIIVAVIMLPMMNSDYIYTIQDNSLFVSGKTFMTDIVGTWGWTAWASAYLTQFFYHPWLGSSIIITIWAICYLLNIYSLKMTEKVDRFCFIAAIPLLFLLFYILDYGYWIYYTKNVGYAFAPSIIYLICSIIVFAVSIPLKKFLRGKTNIISITAQALSFGFILINSFFLNKDHQSEISITLNDKNFKHELKMYRALEDMRYEDVIKEMQDSEGDPTNLMVMLKNIALLHNGNLTDMFKTKNCGIVPETGDSLNIHISQLAAPLIYFQIGQMNYAYRWAMENNVKIQSVRNIKIMALSAIMNKEFDVAAKYITILKATTFHKEWAYQHERMLYNSTELLQSEYWQRFAPLMIEDSNSLDSDNNLCEKWILDHYCDIINAPNDILEEMSMCISLWTEDDFSFCLQFYAYCQNHPKESIPALYQEAAIMLCTAAESPVKLDNFPFDIAISQRYNQFVGDYMSITSQSQITEQMRDEMKNKYGDTYWYYYYFYNDFEIY